MTSEHEPDLILITESWLNPEISNAMLNVQNYSLEPELRKDRADTLNGIGGGLLVYGRNGLTLKPNENFSDNAFNQFCSFQIIGEKNDETLDICLVYRSPNSTEGNTLELCELIKSHPNTMYIGDINLPGINWQLNTSYKKGLQLLETANDAFMEQLIDFPTHAGGNTLDLCLTNKPENVINVSSIGYLGNSDHTIIQLDVIFSAKLNKSDELVRDWASGDINGLKIFLDNQDWERKLNNLTTDEAWAEFTSTLNEGTDKYIPLTRRRRPRDPPWMNKYVKRSCNKKKRHWKTYVENRNPENFAQYKRSEQEAKKAVRNAKKSMKKKLHLVKTKESLTVM